MVAVECSGEPAGKEAGVNWIVGNVRTVRDDEALK
jgi:hypothetical protein